MVYYAATIRYLIYEITKQHNALGLYCHYDSYHGNHELHSALAYDVIEQFRHLVDGIILDIQHQIRKIGSGIFKK